MWAKTNIFGFYQNNHNSFFIDPNKQIVYPANSFSIAKKQFLTQKDNHKLTLHVYSGDKNKNKITIII